MYFIGGSFVGVLVRTRGRRSIPGPIDTGPDCARDRGMDKATDRPPTGKPNAIPGADAAALGQAPAPDTAPPGARVDASEHRVPGSDADDRPTGAAKPWFTSLAAKDPQAGVGNEAPEEAPEDPLTDAEVRGRSE
jgi:hypothetical protein